MLGGADDGTRVALLTGSMATAARRRGAARRGVSGEAGIVIGTHALLEENVQFADLGLVVVDEQHRFGVEQRAALTAKAGTPAARAGDDRDADPAHRRDDRVRRPRDLDADRAAGRPRADRRPTSCPWPSSRGWLDRGLAAGARGGRRRATRPTSCARGSRGDELEQGEADAPTTTTTASDAAAPARLSAVEEVVARAGRAARSPGCGSRCCTAGWRPTTRTA